MIPENIAFITPTSEKQAKRKGSISCAPPNTTKLPSVIVKRAVGSRSPDDYRRFIFIIVMIKPYSHEVIS